MPAPILHFEYSLFSKLSKPAAGVLARGSSFIAGQIAELSFGKGCRITLALPGFCPRGAEVVRRMTSHNFRGPHDEIQIKIQSLDPLRCTNDQQIQASLTIR